MVTTESILRIEEELKVVLPDGYKAVLLAYPFGPDSASYVDYFQDDLLDDAEALIERNQGHRASGYFGQHWPDHYFTIGSDSLDNDYFLDLNEPISAVYLANHERTARADQLEFEEKAANLAAFVEWLKAQAAEFQREERQVAERRQNRKWWQFWL